jgi:UDP-N-acetylmuramate--alanine ligase
VVTNIEADHMDTYGGDFGRLRNTFTEFLRNLPFYGLAVLCADDPELAQRDDAVGRPLLHYGFAPPRTFASPTCARRAAHAFHGAASGWNGSPAVTLNMPGLHNVLNATAAVAVATDQGIDDDAIVDSLAGFAGVGRRFTVYDPQAPAPRGGSRGRLRPSPDGGRGHPGRGAPGLARSAPGDGLPAASLHAHPRSLRRLRRVLSDCDRLLLLEVYAAGEEPIAGADSRSLARSIRQRGQLDPLYARRADDVPALLAEIVQPGDVVVAQGAGDIAQLARQLREGGTPDA